MEQTGCHSQAQHAAGNATHTGVTWSVQQKLPEAESQKSPQGDQHQIPTAQPFSLQRWHDQQNYQGSHQDIADHIQFVYQDH